MESILLNESVDAAICIVNICKEIRNSEKEFVLTNQLLRSGTSIGANIHESKYAQSTADFVSKMQIALKECYETEYWLRIMKETGYIKDEKFFELKNKCGSIRRKLISSINTEKNSVQLC